MEQFKKKLDESTQALSEQEPHFAPNFAAARIILDGAHVGNAGLAWASGAVCGPAGCSCGNRGCLHATAWRIFTYAAH